MSLEDVWRANISRVYFSPALSSQPPVVILQVLLALDLIWHIEHFVCAYCKRQLGTDVFYENDGQPYCELDYQELFLPKCADCHAAIVDVSRRLAMCITLYVCTELCFLDQLAVCCVTARVGFLTWPKVFLPGQWKKW